MELRELAERILFSTSLETKLQAPESITDRCPGDSITAPAVPGRPGELKFKPKGGRTSDFPGLHQLEREGERGKLLHFFANHELLAVELMALVLLRFPAAPSAFRRGVLQTLRDEQEHTRLYLERMQKCGIHFGELPVSGFFWRALSAMENPMDYVAGLSLTFEQANLDFARQYSNAFALIGDGKTSDLLDRIYRDEIGHVAYGLKWFRRWKNPQQTDWEAFRSRLKFPLSPQRAKGEVLNKEGRRAAGLDETFIAELSVYAQSKGRTPSVFLFNPFAEGYLAQGKSFTPVKHQALMARDLENLPQFLCSKDDIVLVEKRPSIEFRHTIQNAGFALPEFVEIQSGSGGLPPSLKERKLSGLRPWAWGLETEELLRPLFPNTDLRRKAEHFFNSNIAARYSKEWSAAILRKFIGNVSSEERPWLCTENEIGVTVADFEAALAAIREIRGRTHHKLVAKQDLGLAGRNAIRLWEPEILEPQLRWMKRSLDQGRKLIIEPWLERCCDFSVQLEMTGPDLKLIGFTTLLVDSKGQYQGNRAAPNFRRSIPAAAILCFSGQRDIGRKIQHLYSQIIAMLEQEFRAVNFQGPIGIDAFVFSDAMGRPRLKPIVEINPRFTMGRLALELMKHACPGSHGALRLWNRSEISRAGFETFADYARAQIDRFPLRLQGDPVPRISEGLVCLNDPESAQACLATFQVASQAGHLRTVSRWAQAGSGKG